MVIAVALGITLPILFTRGSPRAAGAQRPGTSASAGAATGPSRKGPTPAASTPRQTPTSTAPSRSPSPSAQPTARPASSPTSASPRLVAVPDTIGLTKAQAIQRLQAAGFAVKAETFGTLNDDKVWDYTPVGPAPRGSTVTIDVGL